MSLRQSWERRVPNEISSIVIENLADNFPALRNTALACRDFAALAQPHIFREIDLEENYCHQVLFRSYPRVHRLASLLQNSEINRYVQRLHLSSSGIPSDVVAHILRHLTALTSLSIHDPECRLFQEIETSSVRGTLKQLHLYSPFPCRWDFVSFKRMLLSLSDLEVLAVCGSRRFSEPGAFLLPSSLRMASFTKINADLLRAIGAGLQISPLPFLHTLILDPFAAIPRGHVDWNGLASDTQIIYKVHTDYFTDPFRQARSFTFATRGIAATKLMFICLQSPWIAQPFACIISHLPGTVRELCINITAEAQDAHCYDRSLPRSPSREWTEFDSALVKRHEQGLLHRVCFRCTKCEGTGSPKHYIFSYSSLHNPTNEKIVLENRTILDEVEDNLPRSKGRGFLEVDRDTVFFEPTM
ncbi:hypothetical protein GYMLUDRAFT_44460 [Collybiopsis luxurians FD-317 M1]|uniref:F-box domain-containing protein n=1 Tax=Collybiopsis luxurians FD-317 M1 TaxID=944289 RepID=A0A0D0CAM1_9AGAR|nr:hypothetical protein GYMLUDRAFT_44460 [Collybiopsis luxurians FD-317 M1]